MRAEMAETPKPLTPEELAALDAQYVPFPAFADWPQSVPFLRGWAGRTSELDDRAEAEPGAVEDAREVAVRAAAWDTGAIEGLYTTNRGITMTIAMQAAEWETEIAAHGAEAAALFDAQLATYELVLDVATQRQPITEAWIRRLHEELTEPQETYTVHTPTGPRQEPLPRGEYKSRPNHVERKDGGRHAYAPVADTPPEMHRLVEELSSDAFAGSHPILQASYSHYALAAVHPFADGNGRVARALASVYLYRAARIPLMIFADDRDAYLDALARADTAAYATFVSYIARAAIESSELILEALATRAAPDASSALEQFRELLTVQAGLTHMDIDAIGVNLLTTYFLRILNEEIGKLNVPNGVSVTSSGGSGSYGDAPDGYRNIPPGGGGQFAQITFTSAPPSEARRQAEFRIFVSVSGDEEDLFWLVQVGTGNGSKFALWSVHPALTPAAEERLHLLAQRTLGQELDLLYADARQAFEAIGYPAPGAEHN